MSDKCAKAGRNTKGDLGRFNTARHKARRIKREQARQEAYELTAPRRRWLRKRGALARINRRIAEANESDRARLSAIRARVAEAERSAQQAAA